MTIPEILQDNARRWPNREALAYTRRGRDEKLSFAELENLANNFASRLAQSGVRPGDPVLVFVPMSPELYVGLLGLFRLGATAVFLDPSAGPRHIAACCARLPPAALLSIWPLRLARVFLPGLRRIPRVFRPPSLTASPAGALPPFPAPDDPALITFTSGSTGEPKAAVRSHRFLIAQHEALRDAIRLEPGERDLTTLPIFVLANLASGLTSILPDARISRPGSVNASRLAAQIARLKPTRTGGSPAFYQRLATRPASLAGFHQIYTGGAPVFPRLLRELQSHAPRADVVAVYGSTEAEPIAHVAAAEITDTDWQAMASGRGLLAGAPVPCIRLRIVADQWGAPLTRPESLPPGAPGEILVTGDHVLQGYLHGRGDTETKVPLDGVIWHRTGDAGYLDPAGRLWLLGRCSARLTDGAETLYPFAAECVAMTFPGVCRAAFVQLDTRRLLALECDGPLPPGLPEALAWTRLTEIRRLPHLPVDPRHNAKINYPKLLRLLRR